MRAESTAETVLPPRQIWFANSIISRTADRKCKRHGRGREGTMEQEYIEIKAKTLEDAITAACQRLSVISDRLDYIVVSEGSSGFLGFNAKPAVIKARIKAVSLSETESVLK